LNGFKRVSKRQLFNVVTDRAFTNPELARQITDRVVSPGAQHFQKRESAFIGSHSPAHLLSTRCLYATKQTGKLFACLKKKIKKSSDGHSQLQISVMIFVRRSLVL
jgi:hypothetical protein